jgi:hypothetical protein
MLGVGRKSMWIFFYYEWPHDWIPEIIKYYDYETLSAVYVATLSESA